MSLLEKLNLSSKTCKLPIIERIALGNAEKAKIKTITEGLGCAADEYGDMLSHEIAEMVLREIEKGPPSPVRCTSCMEARRSGGGRLAPRKSLSNS